MTGIFVACKQEKAAPALSSKTEIGTKLKVNSGVVYNIPVGTTIVDHSDPTAVGSIAWYFATYGAGNTYNLSSTATYNVYNTLVIPANSTLGEATGVNAMIAAGAAWVVDADPFMVIMNNDGTTIRDINLNGQFRAKQIISGNGHDVSLLGITAQKSQKIHDGHLIVFSTAQNVTITNCLLRRAGCDTESGFAREASLIYTRKCDTVTIKNNDMAIAASAGINYTGSTNVTIAGNEISDTGRSDTPLYIADGITSYHSQLGYLYQNVWITDNKIWNCRNHGIHVSGRDIHIENNKIYACGLTTSANSIRLGDQYSPGDCSSNVTIKNNTLSDCPPSGHAIYILGPYKSTTVTISGNTILSGCSTYLSTDTCL